MHLISIRLALADSPASSGRPTRPRRSRSR